VKLGLFGFHSFDQTVGSLDRSRGPLRDHSVKVFDFPVDFRALFTHCPQPVLTRGKLPDRGRMNMPEVKPMGMALKHRTFPGRQAGGKL
jgi:hypothetical protein